MLPLYTDVFDPLLTEDVETLLGLFQQMDSVRFQVFSELWRQLSFSDVFLGLSGYGELRRFCRIAMATAAKYFLPPYSYQIRVGGLYLMFALYHAQPCRPQLKIRLALRSWSYVQNFLTDSAKACHFDVVYIYEKLVTAKAFHYAVMPHFLTFQKQRKPKKWNTCRELVGRATAVRQLLTADVLQELSHVQTHYERLKEATEEVKGEVNTIHKDLSSQLKDAMTEFIAWQESSFSKSEKTGEEDEEEKEEKEVKSNSRRARLLSSIKDKSYKNFQEAPKSRRHRKVQMSEPLAAADSESFAPRRKKPPSLKVRTSLTLGAPNDHQEVQTCTLKKPQLTKAWRRPKEEVMV